MTVDAIVTAGGKGTRIKELGMEKPMIKVLEKPIIERVLDALNEAKGVRDIFVSVSDSTPVTKDYVEHLGYTTIHTSGKDYVKDLRASMKIPSSRAVVVCPADLPLITSNSVDQVVSEYPRAGFQSLAVAIPSHCILSIGLEVTFEMEVNGNPVVMCGVSVVDRGVMLSGEYLEEGYFISQKMDFALNVNSIQELRMAERILEKRSQSSKPRI
ncbi:MAG: NTP transferase domain-containing protein [Methanomassiliicoccales archaeon]|nr:NTP transferase domain-containing protein [Methanomassiliicoccales archaeon]NYT14575.1 NTP transferase domain-containing protein [Methanomassiliicoccales archaeon]